MTPFRDISLALMGPRASGRTYRIIENAPKGATLLACRTDHANWLKSAATEQGRDDLKVTFPNGHNLVGQRGEFIPDHFSIECWLMEAQSQIDKLTNEVIKQKLRAELAERENKRLRKSAA